MGRKHCVKRRNCSLRAISPFPAVFSKGLYCRHVKTRACLGKSYLFPKRQNFGQIEIESICRRQNECDCKIEILFWEEKKTLWGKEKMLIKSIFSFSHNVFKRLHF